MTEKAFEDFLNSDVSALDDNWNAGTSQLSDLFLDIAKDILGLEINYEGTSGAFGFGGSDPAPFADLI